MHRLIYFKIVVLVVLQHILAAVIQRPKPRNPCPNDFLRIQSRCYYFSSQGDTWEGAKWKCVDRNSTLAVITSERQNKALTEFLKKGYLDTNLPPPSRLQTSAPRWLGGQYDWMASEWKWIYNGKTISHSLYNKERFRSKKLEWHCLTIDPNSDYSWRSDSCFEKNYYICQTKLIYQKNSSLPPNDKTRKPEFVPNNLRTNSTPQHVSDSQPAFYVVTAGNSVPSKGNERKKKKPKKKSNCPKNFVPVGKKCYYLSRNKASWTDAFYKCQDMDSELAILKNVQQDKRLRSKVKKFHLSNTPSWIGGQYNYKEHVWIWAATGTKLPIQPTVTKQWACAVWDPNTNDEWTSENCLVPMPFICQTTVKPAAKRIPSTKTSQSKTNPRHS